jgi:peroxiredoxin
MSDEDPAAGLEAAIRTAMASTAPSAERLRAVADYVRNMNVAFAEGVDRFLARLEHAQSGAAAPQVGERLPSFLLPDQDGRLAALETFLSQGPVLVNFLRGHWCPYCRVATAALAQAHAQITEAGGGIVAISPEFASFAQHMRADAGADFPVLADLDNGYALSLNLAVWVDDDMASLMSGAGVDLPRYQGNSSWIIPIPATFALDRDGVIIQRHVNVDYRERADLNEMISVLRRLA